MLTLYHSPMSRSTNVVALLAELGATDKVALEIVTIARRDGTGGADPRNPHPEGKVPLLVHDGQAIREQSAIFAHLCSVFPQAGLAPQPGTPEHGVFLAWLAYCQGVLEPVLMARFSGKPEDPAFRATFRGWEELVTVLETALAKNTFLMGDKFSAADLLIHAPFAWFPEARPERALINDWVERCAARPAIARTLAEDAERAQSM